MLGTLGKITLACPVPCLLSSCWMEKLSAVHTNRLSMSTRMCIGIDHDYNSLRFELHTLMSFCLDVTSMINRQCILPESAGASTSAVAEGAYQPHDEEEPPLPAGG